MKNIRKIVAILAAVLMFCSVLPMSAFAAEGDVVASFDWNDGEVVFDVGEVVAEGPDGSNCYKWAFGGGWSSNYMVVKNMDPAKDYTITMKAKGSAAGQMGITIQNGDWGSYWNGPTFNVTTEWQEVVIPLPANGIPFAAGSILFKFQGNGGNAYDLYVDDLVISEGLPKVPLCENGDFETGDGTNWILSQGSAVDATAAQNGSYGAHLISGVNWNSMLERTFDVVAGKKYELTFWAKTVSGGSNIKFLDQNWQGSDLATGVWFNKADWTQVAVTFTAISDKFYFQFCGAGDVASELYVDDVNLIEVKDPSYDGYITNGDFEIGKTAGWTNLYGSTTHEIVEGYTSDYALKGTASSGYNITYQEVAVEPNTDYTVICYSKDSFDSALWIKNAGGNGDIVSNSFNSGSDWGLTVSSFNSGSNSSIWVGLMGVSAGSTYTVDNVTMFKALPVSNDDYLSNTNFEGGSISGWSRIWDGQISASIVVGGKDDNFAVYVAGKPDQNYGQLRQTVTVEPNTDYKVTVWAKNSSGMSLLVKDGADTYNINNVGASAGDEWTLITNEFNSGSNTTVLVGVMEDGDGYGTFDGFLMEKVVCEHEYDDCLDADCNLCGETREPGHVLTYFEAVVATNCQETGHAEYWYCENCECYFGDAEATWQHNPGWLFTTGECVRPEGAADCATVPCELCGNDTYGAGDHDVVVCQGGVCSKCNAEIEGVGHQNYDGPACLPGNCYYCGEAMEPVAHENGAWAPCLEGECAYGCGLTYPATEDHVDADGDDYCDNCWNHLACIDEDGDGFCDVCWSEIPQEPVDIIYGDADGDGEITLLDANLLQQYLGDWDVTLGPVEEVTLFNDGEITKW